MIVYPAIDVWGDRVVKLDSSNHARVEKDYGGLDEIYDRWFRLGSRWFHLVDVGSAVAGGKPGRAAALHLARRSVGAQFQFGGGLREETSIVEAAATMHRVMLGTAAIEDPVAFRTFAERFPQKFVVALDAAGDQVLVNGWQKKSGDTVEDLVAIFEDMPVAGVLYTNVWVEGKGRGVMWEPVRRLLRATKLPVTFAGGVSSIDDVKQFRDLGAAGVILGSGLYSGKVDLAQAIEESGK